MERLTMEKGKETNKVKLHSAFHGEGAYEAFKKIASEFYKDRTYKFVALTLDANPRPDGVEFTAEFWRVPGRDAMFPPPCYSPDAERPYSPDTDVGCRRVVPYVDDEPIDRCKECPLCYSDKQRHRSEPNAPLTMAELREMDGEPVWGADGKYYIVNVEAGYASDKYRGFRMLWEDRFFFRRKPEEVIP